MSGRYKSLDVNCYAQVFNNKFFLVATYPMEKKILAGQVLREFIGDFRVIKRLVFNISKEQTSKGTVFRK